MSPTAPDSEARDTKGAFVQEVRLRRKRHERNEEEKESSYWSSVGTMGMVGWSVALPLTVGALLGRWLDGRLGSGIVFLVFFIIVGVCVGCYMAWRMVSEKL